MQLVYAYEARGDRARARRAIEGAVKLSTNPEMRTALVQMLLAPPPDDSATLQE